jgi:transcriptional repressor NrdR
VWRRRQCLSCGAVFTTEETAHYPLSWLVKQRSGTLEPFQRDKLFVSVYNSCQHRKTALTDAGSLTDTIIGRLLSQSKGGMLDYQVILQTAQVTLARFDKAAAVHYQANHYRS